MGLLPDDRSTKEVMHHERGSPLRIKAESRARRAIEKYRSSHYLLLFSALFGACLVIGDAVLTPSISGSRFFIRTIFFSVDKLIGILVIFLLAFSTDIMMMPLPVLSAFAGLQRALSQIKCKI